MSIQMLGRCALVLGVIALATGCSSSRSTGKLFNQCTWSPSSCMYEGSYEPGEEEYAEKEAQRLNRAQLR